MSRWLCSIGCFLCVVKQSLELVLAELAELLRVLVRLVVRATLLEPQSEHGVHQRILHSLRGITHLNFLSESFLLHLPIR